MIVYLTSGSPFFSCSCKKRIKRSRHRGGIVCLAQLRAKSRLRWLRSARACGRSRNPIHPPLCTPPGRIADGSEHLNVNPVQAENVPIFCPKLRTFHIGRAARAEPPPSARRYVSYLRSLRCWEVMAKRPEGFLRRADRIAGASRSAPP